MYSAQAWLGIFIINIVVYVVCVIYVVYENNEYYDNNIW